jgi:cytoskeletal protein RodZ
MWKHAGVSRLKLIAAWFVVAALATGLAWGVLSVAAGEVVEAPDTPVLAVDVTSPTVTTASDVAGAPSTPVNSSSNPSGESAPSASDSSSTTSTTTADSSTTADPESPTTTSSTSTVPGSTTTTASAGTWSQTTVPTAGGVVVVGHRPGEVRLDSATPAPGFTMEIDKQGPDEVRVEFDSQGDSFEIRVRWENGVLSTEVS